MPKEYQRHRRVGDLIQRELAMIIERERMYPDMSMLTISTTDISPDLKNAKIYFTAFCPEDKRKELTKSLNEDAGHYRQLLSKQIALRGVPKLQFIYDNQLENANRVNDLIARANKSSDS